MAFESSYYECFIEYACSQIWHGEDPLKWADKIKEIRQFFNPVGDLAQKTWLCFFLLQLHIHLKRVQQGTKTFHNQKKFCETLRTVTRLFPFSKVEMECMTRKLRAWTLKTRATVPECQAMIKEMKQFLQPVYQKLENSQSEDAFKAYQKKLNRNTKLPTASTLKEVFLWMFNGTTEQAKKEWEAITRGKHPDVIQLKRKLAKKSTVSGMNQNIRHKNSEPGVNLINTLPGCSVSLQDTKKHPVCKKFDAVNSKKGKQPKYANLRNTAARKQRLAMLDYKTYNCYSSAEDSDQHSTNHQESGSFDSSEGIVDPSQEENDSLSGSNGKKRNTNLPLFNKTESEQDEVEISHLRKRDFRKKFQRPRKQILLGETDIEQDELEIKHSPKRGISKKVDKLRTKEMVCSDEQKKIDKLVMVTRSTASNLSEASHNLMKIVNDPYEKTPEDSDDEVKLITPKKGKRSRWMDPQTNAAVLSWSSSDEGSDEDLKKIELPSGQKFNKGLINLTTNKIDSGRRHSPAKPKRRRKRYWTLEEMDWIREGVKIFGQGNWAHIVINYPFVNRSSVDIKDKYRNMVRNAEI